MRPVALLGVVLLACGPEGGGETGGPGDAAGPGGTGGEVVTTGDVLATSGATTEAPEAVAPAQVVVLLGLLAEPSGVAEIDPFEPQSMWCGAGPTPICADPPQLGPPRLLVDGLFAGPGAVEVGSRVAVLYPYTGCDVACGNFVVTAEGHFELAEGEGQLPPDLPCSTAADDVWLAVDFGVIDSGMPRSVELQLTDACSTMTEAQQLVFAAK